MRDPLTCRTCGWTGDHCHDVSPLGCCDWCSHNPEK